MRTTATSTDFPKPLEAAIETRFKIAEMYKAAHDDVSLSEGAGRKSYASTRAAGPERTGRTRTLAGRSALVLAEQLYQACVAVKLRQPFETSLKEKKQRMDATIKAMGGLVNYRNRRRDGSRHVLHGRDLLRFQSLTEGVGAPRRYEARGSGRVRGGPR